MTSKVKKSDSYKKKMARLKKLPQMMEQAMMGLRKKDAKRFITIFHDGIRDNKLGLINLTKTTIEIKKEKGYKKPKTPLYGKGDEEEKRSYVNMLRIRKIKNGWKVFPSWGKHHEANEQLRELLKKHEVGFTIERNGVTLRVPPRPAFLIAKNKFLMELSKSQQDKKIKRELMKFINEGNDQWFKEMMREYSSGKEKEE